MNFLFRRFISPTQNRQFWRDNFDYGRIAKWAFKSKFEKGILCERKKEHFNANFPKKKISGNFHNCRKQRFGYNFIPKNMLMLNERQCQVTREFNPAKVCKYLVQTIIKKAGIYK